MNEVELEMDEIVMGESTLNEAQLIVEAIAATHLSISCSNDQAIAGWQSPVYKASQTLFKAAIHAAYPKVGEDSVYDFWAECNESIEYCAAQVKETEEFEAAQAAYSHIRHQFTGEEIIIESDLFSGYANTGWLLMGTMNKEDADALKCTCSDKCVSFRRPIE